MITHARVRLLASLAGAAAVLAYAGYRNGIGGEVRPSLRVAADTARILADGNDTATLRIDGPAAGVPRIVLVGNPHGAAVLEPAGGAGHWEAQVHAGIVPGILRFQVAMAGAWPAFAEIEAVADWRDSLEDGTPDFLRLDDNRDRQAFRRWFTFLAEAQYFQPAASRPAEIDDCAALIRYAYREALHIHDEAWTSAARLPLVPPFDSVAKYQYPYTPLGAALFRVHPGPLRPADSGNGAFAEFADAATLRRLNCHFLSRELSAALPGDLLFFRQDAAGGFHSMIYLGSSQIRRDAARYVVYHTGPEGSDLGEIRRLSTDELMRFPRPEWRPLVDNPGFLGVYRWNILCSAGTNWRASR